VGLNEMGLNEMGLPNKTALAAEKQTTESNQVASAKNK
jgi:hypothetical protein